MCIKIQIKHIILQDKSILNLKYVTKITYDGSLEKFLTM